MKTYIRPETVKFSVVTQCGKHWAFAQTQRGEVRLYWSHLRLVESACGGIVFSTGKSPSVRRGDEVAFVSQKDGLWLWVLRADYDTVVDFLKRNPTPSVHLLPVAPLPEPPPAPTINLDQEMAALGSAQLQKWQRRYGAKRAFA